jgi:MFS family permease
VVLVLLTLAPGLATRYLGLGAEDAPLVALPAGVGFLVGAFVLGRWNGSMSRPAWISAGLTGLGLALVLMAALVEEGGPQTTWLILVLVLAIGFALALVIVPARTVLQERPSPPMRGRVIAAQLALSHVVSVFPLLLGGALADSLGIQPVMGLLVVPVLGAGAFGMYHIRSRTKLPAKG